MLRSPGMAPSAFGHFRTSASVMNRLVFVEWPRAKMLILTSAGAKARRARRGGLLALAVPKARRTRRGGIHNLIWSRARRTRRGGVNYPEYKKPLADTRVRSDLGAGGGLRLVGLEDVVLRGFPMEGDTCRDGQVLQVADELGRLYHGHRLALAFPCAFERG